MEEKNYLIAWKSQSNARMGVGKILMDQEEAERLATELNSEHPDFEHVVVHRDETNITSVFRKIVPPPEPVLVPFPSPDPQPASFTDVFAEEEPEPAVLFEEATGTED